MGQVQRVGDDPADIASTLQRVAVDHELARSTAHRLHHRLEDGLAQLLDVVADKVDRARRREPCRPASNTDKQTTTTNTAVNKMAWRR